MKNILPNMEQEKEYPTAPTVEFTEDEWNTVHTGYIVESTFYSHLVQGDGYGRFWIPKCYVRIKNPLIYMKKIIIYYWIGKKTKDFDLNYEHNQEIPYSVEKRNEIIDEILNKGYNLMIRSRNSKDVPPENLVIYISQYSFGQR